MLRTVITLAIMAVIVYFSLAIALFFFQRSLIYYPQPFSTGISTTILRLPVNDAQVLVSARPRAGAKALIYLGGNAEDVSANLPTFSEAFPYHALYFLHYRGYGGSSGSPSEEHIQRDAVALFDMVHQEHPDVVLVGRSLGTGVALRLASQRTVSRMVLITPFYSLQELAANQFPYFPVKWLLRDKYESWRYAAHISAPTLLLGAEHDEVVPASSTEKLYTHFAKGVASLRIIPGVGHNTISESSMFFTVLREAL